MTSKLSASAAKVKDFLDKEGFSFNVVELPSSTRTAKEAADAIGCSVAQIAKSLVFEGVDTKEAVLIVASGINRVDLKKFELVTGLKIKKADADFVKKQTGFSIGGIPPAGHIKPIKTYLDKDLKKYDSIWAAAGTPFAVFELNPEELEELTGGEWIDLT